MVIVMSNLDMEYRVLDIALNYWSDPKLHKILKKWYNRLNMEDVKNGKRKKTETR